VAKGSKILINNLKGLLEKADWSQADLARKLKVATSNVSNWFIGKNTPSVDTLDDIADVFGVTVADLFATKEIPEPRVHVEKVELPDVIRNEIHEGNAKLLAQITEKIGPVLSALQAAGAEEVVVREAPKDKLQAFFNRLLRDPGFSGDFYKLVDEGADYALIRKTLLKELQEQEKGSKK